MTEWNIDKLLLYPDKAIKELNDNRKRLQYVKRVANRRSEPSRDRIEEIQCELDYYED